MVILTFFLFNGYVKVLGMMLESLFWLADKRNFIQFIRR